MARDVKLKRSLGLALTTLYGLGTILGAGIYVLIGEIAGIAGVATPLAFVTAALLAGLSAMSYRELAARFPKSSGEAYYLWQGFRSGRLSQIIGLLIACSGMISAALLCQGFAGYLQDFVELPKLTVTISVLAFLTALTLWGVKESVGFASLITLLEIAGLLLIVGTSTPSWQNAPMVWNELSAALTQWPTYSGILAAAFLAFYAFIGFEDIVNVAEEVKNPQKNLPRAITLAIVIATILYALVGVVATLSVPAKDLANSSAPLALVLQTNTTLPSQLISGISLLAIVNGAIIQLIMSSRLLYGMAAESWLPSALAKVHPKTQTPIVSIFCTAFAILLLMTVFPLVTLAKMTSYIVLTVFVFVNVALILVQSRDTQSPVHTPRVIPWIGAIATGLFLAFEFYQTIIR